MPTSEIFTDGERSEHYSQWVAEKTADRLAALRAKRPAKFTASGALHPGICAWADGALTGHPGNLKIVGNIGSGKSWSLWTLAEHLVTSGFRGRIEIIPAHRLKRLIAPPVDFAMLDALINADLLALDDVAAIRVSDWDAEHLYGIFDERWSANRPIIVASNQPVLAEVIGPRAASRLGDKLTTVKITGPDRRGLR